MNNLFGKQISGVFELQTRLKELCLDSDIPLILAEAKAVYAEHLKQHKVKSTIPIYILNKDGCSHWLEVFETSNPRHLTPCGVVSLVLLVKENKQVYVSKYSLFKAGRWEFEGLLHDLKTGPVREFLQQLSDIQQQRYVSFLLFYQRATNTTPLTFTYHFSQGLLTLNVYCNEVRIEQTEFYLHTERI